MSSEIEVHIELGGTTHVVGRLWVRSMKGRESASFKYDERWLMSPLRFSLDPSLHTDVRMYHTQQGRSIFGAIGDSAPDRWGRMLMKRRERRLARKEKRPVRALTEQDFLLMVDDRIRQGALRFRYPRGAFLSHEESAIPPLVRLSELLSASERVLTDRDSDEDLKVLLAPGSSLGGARPKASVLDSDGSLAIAKFPNTTDEYNVEKWGHLAFRLAEKAGIAVPQSRIIEIAGSSVLLSKRFDRQGVNRLPFLSAMSMIGAADNEAHSYLEMADALRRYGATPQVDLQELWKRVLFFVLVSNVDDHLRNTGFLYNLQGKGWCLSPAYDINPVPRDIKPGYLSTLIDDKDSEADFDLLLGTREYYGLSDTAVRNIVEDVFRAVSQWDREAKRLKISKREIERMQSAFHNQALVDAKHFLGTVSRKHPSTGSRFHPRP